MFTINGKPVDTFSDSDLVDALDAKKLIEGGTIGFSLADQSSEPFAWMVEGGVEASDISDATEYVKAFVERDCNVYNYSGLDDSDLASAIMELGLADGAVGFISEWKQQ